MIIVLEGANGVGKTAYIERLSKVLDIKAFKPWRGAKEACKEGGGRNYGLLDTFGIPVNTHVDDFYAIDFIEAFGVDAILDRSLPSAIVYGTLPGASPLLKSAMLKYWLEVAQRASQGKFLYVWLKAPHKIVKKRIEHRWCPNKSEYDKLEKQFGRAFELISLPKIQIDTSCCSISDGLRRICQALKS